MFTIWNKDFEYDNFGPGKVIKKVNQMLRSRGLNTVSIKDVKRRMVTNQDALMKALDNVIRKNNNGKKLDDVVSKKKLAEDLIAPRIKKIEQEYTKNQWKPRLPIEVKIKKIFEMHPKRL